MEFCAAASLIMVHLSRLAEEVILWASEEFAFIRLTDRCATGSSLMPQKKNPDVPELVRGKCGRVFGHLQGLLVMIKGLPLAYNKDFQEDKEALFDTVRTSLDCLEAMAILLEEGISFRPERLEAAVGSDFSNATDVADYLVAKGVPFREAYQLVGGLVKTCLKEGILLRDLPLERWQQLHPAFDQAIYAAIAPARWWRPAAVRAARALIKSSSSWPAPAAVSTAEPGWFQAPFEAAGPSPGSGLG